MGVYLINESDMVGIADAVRAKTGKTKKISFDNIVSEIASISGGVDLNFNIVGGLEQPTNPTENMIWIETNEEITKWIFSSSEPNAPEEGMVWIYTGIDSDAAFNVLKENMIQVYPLSAKLFINNKWNSYGVNIYKEGQWLTLNTIPEFTYTGSYTIVNDNDEAITSSKDNWKIKFLTSGTLTFINLNGAGAGIDVFCVGGGGGGGAAGGGGGYTTTEKDVMVEVGTDYEIVVGAGGGNKIAGGKSSAFEVTANGGGTARDSLTTSAHKTDMGGNGGSGGGGFGGNATPGNGGSNGGNGGAGIYGAGSGQGTTTREFGEETGTLYAGGGGGSGGSIGQGGSGGGGNGQRTGDWSGKTAGATNTGGGGGGGFDHNGAAGGSGIVIIRNARG